MISASSTLALFEIAEHALDHAGAVTTTREHVVGRWCFGDAWHVVRGDHIRPLAWQAPDR